MTAPILRDLTAPAIIAALEANLEEGYIRLGQALGAEFHNDPDALWFVSGIPLQVPNGVVRFRAIPERASGRIDALLGEYAQRHVPSCWLLNPSTTPANLAELLHARGFFSEFAPGMAADLHAVDFDVPLAAGLKVQLVANETAMADWLRVLVVGSSFPPEVERVLFDLLVRQGFHFNRDVRFFLGTLNGQPASTSMLFLGGGIAGIYCVATVPDARQRGLGTALTLAAMREGLADGYHVAGLQSSEMGLRVYQRLGFREYCTFGTCFSPPGSEEQQQ